MALPSDADDEEISQFIKNSGELALAGKSITKELDRLQKWISDRTYDEVEVTHKHVPYCFAQ